MEFWEKYASGTSWPGVQVRSMVMVNGVNPRGFKAIIGLKNGWEGEISLFICIDGVLWTSHGVIRHR